MTTATAPPPKTRMGADEFFDFVNRPEHDNRWFELVRGEVIEVPPPTLHHGVVATNVSYELTGYARRVRRGFVASNDSGVILERDPDTVRGPDVAYYDNASKFEDINPKWSDTPPVLAVEVRSPGDRPGRLDRKVQDYIRGGVKLVWIVDFEEKTVSVHRPGKSVEVHSAPDVLDGGIELPGLQVSVEGLFTLFGSDTDGV